MPAIWRGKTGRFLDAGAAGAPDQVVWKIASTRVVHQSPSPSGTMASSPPENYSPPHLIDVKPQHADALIGLLTVAFGAAVIWLVFGLPLLMRIAGICILGGLVLHLWSRESRWARALAVVLMPAVLLIYLVPKNTRHAMHQQFNKNPEQDAPDRNL